ncbi:MAG: DUF4340 domain-containing protein [Rhodospirillaceae bacterium]|jgi:hypothetical protein|nr:DUF4340 domain-containing protein [Rhodospirillaceae bacterium]
MSPRNFATLCVVTVVTVVIAGWIVASRPVIEASDFDGTLAFPGLVESLNDLKTIKIRHKDGVFTLQSTGNGWVFVERDSFPVQDDKIGELVIKLSRMEKIEPKTKLAERYGRLDLTYPEGKEDTRAKAVEFLNADGETVASLLVGKRKFTLGSSEGGTYVLFPDDTQAWLVTGELNPGVRARDWLVREISDIKDKDIKRVTVTHPDGEVLAISKARAEDTNYAVEDVPPGMEILRDTIANDGGRVLSNLLLDDVKTRADVEFPEDKTITAIFEGFEGFTVRVDLIEDGDQNWLRFQGTAPGSNSPAASPEGDGDGAEAKDWNAIIADLNAKSDGWVFQLPGYEVSGIKKRMADMVRETEVGGV